MQHNNLNIPLVAENLNMIDYLENLRDRKHQTEKGIQPVKNGFVRKWANLQ